MNVTANPSSETEDLTYQLLSEFLSYSVDVIRSGTDITSPLTSPLTIAIDPKLVTVGNDLATIRKYVEFGLNEFAQRAETSDSSSQPYVTVVTEYRHQPASTAGLSDLRQMTMVLGSSIGIVICLWWVFGRVRSWISRSAVSAPQVVVEPAVNMAAPAVAPEIPEVYICGDSAMQALAELPMEDAIGILEKVDSDTRARVIRNLPVAQPIKKRLRQRFNQVDLG